MGIYSASKAALKVRISNLSLCDLGFTWLFFHYLILILLMDPFDVFANVLIIVGAIFFYF